MNNEQKQVAGLGVAVFLAMAAFPPWYLTYDKSKDPNCKGWIQYAPLVGTFRNCCGDPMWWDDSAEIAYGRLIFQWFVLGVTVKSLLALYSSCKEVGSPKAISV